MTTIIAADGYGLWHGNVPARLRDPERAIRNALRFMRPDEFKPGVPIRLEKVPQDQHYITRYDGQTSVEYREV